MRPQIVSDFDFTDDICLALDIIEQTRERLMRMERVCGKVRLHINAAKTNF